MFTFIEKVRNIYRKKELIPQTPESWQQQWEGDDVFAAAVTTKAYKMDPPCDIPEIQRQLGSVSSWQEKQSLGAAYFDHHFNRIDLSFLRWRRKDGNPCFAYYPVCGCTDSPKECTIRSDWDVAGWTSGVREYFNDIRDKFRKNESQSLEDGLGVYTWTTITCPFPDGEIPSNIRRLVGRWQETYRCVYSPNRHAYRARNLLYKGSPPVGFRRPVDEIIERPLVLFDRVLVISEAPVWNTTVVTVKDPMVIGGYGSDWWLLATFDLTPLERIAASEWAVGGTTSTNAGRSSD